jgi:hypothetical protein
MSKYEKTTEPNLVRDKSTGAVLNTDLGAYQAIKAQREAKKAQNNLVSDVATLRDEINTLKADVLILMGLLKQILAKE